MAEASGFEWDFLTLVSVWNVFGLPALLGLVVARSLIRGRTRIPSQGDDDGPDARIAMVRQIGLIHYAAGLRALIAFAQEVLTLRTMGIFQSNPITGLIFPFAAMTVNPLVGRGLRRLRPGARRWAIVWYVLWSFFGVWASYWMWRYGASVSAADWPDHVAGKALPLILLVVMYLPRIRRVFVKQSVGRQERYDDASRADLALVTGERSRRRGSPLLACLVLLLLIVVCSTLVVDAADWIHRLVVESE
jgi:hypothetical protein